MRSRLLFPAAIVVLGLALFVAACGDDNSSSGGSNLSGSIKIDGSSTVGPLSEAAAELFREENPDVKITVGISGTGGGFEKFCAGETDISDASRPIEPDEVEACKKNGVEYGETQVANDGTRRGREPRERLGRLPHDGRAEEDLGAEVRRQQLEPGQEQLPGRADEALRRRHRLRDVRLLHRADQR